MPDIFIVVMDTARWDHLSLNGSRRRTTPFLEAIAEECQIFDRARAPSAWTVPSHASLLSGLYPNKHHATQANVNLHPEVPYVAEILKQQGYKTVGIAENPQLSANRGFSRGFDIYHEPFRKNLLQSDARLVENLFQSALYNTPAETPIFGFINLIAPHSPYGAPTRFRESMGSPLLLPEYPNRWQDFYLGIYDPDEEERELLRLEYDAELLYTDSLVQKIWESVESLRDPGRSILVITSDHGENFGDHGHMDHVFCLYDTLIHVPLLIRCPFGMEGGRNERPVQLTDIVPTVLSLAGVDHSGISFDGTALNDALPEPDREQIAEYYYPDQALSGFTEKEQTLPALQPFKRHLRCVVKDSIKFIRASEGPMELYDLTKDPQEETNLIDASEYRAIREELEAVLTRYTEAGGEPTDPNAPWIVEDDPETLKQLEKLGYLR